MKLATVSIIFLFFTNCNKSVNENPLLLNPGQCRNYVYNAESTTICFNKIISDSRCPSNVMCVWAGTAVAEFTFTKGSDSHKLTLATKPVTGLYIKDTIVAGYKIEFINLYPFPKTKPVWSTRYYKAELKVTRL